MGQLIFVRDMILLRRLAPLAVIVGVKNVITNEWAYIVMSGSSVGNSLRVRAYTRVRACDITISPFMICFNI